MVWLVVAEWKQRKKKQSKKGVVCGGKAKKQKHKEPDEATWSGWRVGGRKQQETKDQKCQRSTVVGQYLQMHSKEKKKGDAWNGWVQGVAGWSKGKMGLHRAAWLGDFLGLVLVGDTWSCMVRNLPNKTTTTTQKAKASKQARKKKKTHERKLGQHTQTKQKNKQKNKHLQEDLWRKKQTKKLYIMDWQRCGCGVVGALEGIHRSIFVAKHTALR